MHVLEPEWEVKSWPKDATLEIEDVGRDAYQSHDKMAEGSDEAFCEMLIKRGHEAVLEFADIRVRALTSRDVSHELVRHRHASFLQESQRYCNYRTGLKFIKPIWATKGGVYDEAYEMWLESMKFEESQYAYMVGALGLAPQEARVILPNSTATAINMKHNVRGWREVFILRTSAAAYPPMRRAMVELLIEFAKRCPILFRDILASIPESYLATTSNAS